MKKLYKEIIWIIALLLISYSIWNPQIILDLDSPDSTIDINIHDAYFVIASTNILILFNSSIFSGTIQNSNIRSVSINNCIIRNNIFINLDYFYY